MAPPQPERTSSQRLSLGGKEVIFVAGVCDAQAQEPELGITTCDIDTYISEANTSQPISPKSKTSFTRSPSSRSSFRSSIKRSSSKVGSEGMQRSDFSRSTTQSFGIRSKSNSSTGSFQLLDEVSVQVMIKGDPHSEKHVVPWPSLGSAVLEAALKHHSKDENQACALMRNAWADATGQDDASADGVHNYVSAHLGVQVSALYYRVRDDDAKRSSMDSPKLKLQRLQHERQLVGGMVLCACIDGDTSPPLLTDFSEKQDMCAVM